MKKYISIAFVAIVLSLGFISCDVDTDEEPGGTKVEKMAGRWNVTLDVYDTDGNLLAEDPYHFGVFEIQTYNTVDNARHLETSQPEKKQRLLSWPSSSRLMLTTTIAPSLLIQ